MTSDLENAKRRLASVECLPADDPHRLFLVNHWRAEIRLLSTHIIGDRAEMKKAKRYFRANRKVKRG